MLRAVFAALLLMRLIFPLIDSPLSDLVSDPLRHWLNGRDFFHQPKIGALDPFLYQLWMYLVIGANRHVPYVFELACGVLCAGMPYGWYRGLRELLPRDWALSGAIAIAGLPWFLDIYAFVMNETLLLTLTGYALWLSLRALRKKTVAAFAAACALWVLTIFTRDIALPMAAATLGWIWIAQPDKPRKAAIAAAMTAALAIPAGLHAERTLHFFAPFGSSYLVEIYRAAGTRNVDVFIDGEYRGLTNPSYVNPTFDPLSDWTTDRTGVTAVHVDTGEGRAGWRHALENARRDNRFPFWQDEAENFAYLLFGQPWPDGAPDKILGVMNHWLRWLWPPLILAVACAAAARRFQGREWLLPALALGMFAVLALQRETPMEVRYRKPLDPIFVAAATVALRNQLYPRRRTRQPAMDLGPVSA